MGLARKENSRTWEGKKARLLPYGGGHQGLVEYRKLIVAILYRRRRQVWLSQVMRSSERLGHDVEVGVNGVEGIKDCVE